MLIDMDICSVNVKGYVLRWLQQLYATTQSEKVSGRLSIDPGEKVHTAKLG